MDFPFLERCGFGHSQFWTLVDWWKDSECVGLIYELKKETFKKNFNISLWIGERNFQQEFCKNEWFITDFVSFQESNYSLLNVLGVLFSKKGMNWRWTWVLVLHSGEQLRQCLTGLVLKWTWKRLLYFFDPILRLISGFSSLSFVHHHFGKYKIEYW